MIFSDEDFEPHATPKLTLTKFPSKPRVPIAAPTPPLQPPAAVPFLWEQAPGKPKFAGAGDESPPATAKKVCRSLDLPPRLTGGSTPSPTAVLDWSDGSRSSVSSFRSLEDGITISRLRIRESKEIEEFEESRRIRKGNFDFSLSFSLRDVDFCREKKVAKVRRRSSFLNFSRRTTSTSLLASIYESFKQAVPWRWRQEKIRKVG